MASREFRDLLGYAKVRVEPERSGNLVLEELPEAAVSPINPAEQFSFVEAKADGVIDLAPRPGFGGPERVSADQDRQQPFGQPARRRRKARPDGRGAAGQ